MKKIGILLTFVILLAGSTVSAHVSNEKTIYDDIEFSEAKEEIVYLRGLNVIAHERGANLFKPQEKLTKQELAFWVATYKKLGGHDASKEDLQKAAVDQALIDSLDGNATYKDVNKAYFDGKAPLENADAELTKEDFAQYMGIFLTEKVDGKTLFDMAGYEPGPSGVVEKVEFETEGEGDSAYKVFRYTIGGRVYQLSQHPKILNGPVDLGVWEGKEIEESWLASGHGEEKVVQIVKVKEAQFSDVELGDTQTTGETKQPDNQVKEEKEESQPKKGLPVVLVGGVVILVIVLGWLFMKKK
jgi:hypothetical protein